MKTLRGEKEKNILVLLLLLPLTWGRNPLVVMNSIFVECVTDPACAFVSEVTP